jgi:hypothetical protein
MVSSAPLGLILHITMFCRSCGIVVLWGRPHTSLCRVQAPPRGIPLGSGAGTSAARGRYKTYGEWPRVHARGNVTSGGNNE